MLRIILATHRQHPRECGKGLIEAVEDHLQKQDLSAYTASGYVRDLKRFFAWLREQTGRDILPVMSLPIVAHDCCAPAACRDPAKDDDETEVLTSEDLPENKAARRAHNPEVTGSNPVPAT